MIMVRKLKNMENDTGTVYWNMVRNTQNHGKMFTVGPLLCLEN
jgi:hypothetical protein